MFSLVPLNRKNYKMLDPGPEIKPTTDALTNFAVEPLNDTGDKLEPNSFVWPKNVNQKYL